MTSTNANRCVIMRTHVSWLHMKAKKGHRKCICMCTIYRVNQNVISIYTDVRFNQKDVYKTLQKIQMIGINKVRFRTFPVNIFNSMTHVTTYLF